MMRVWIVLHEVTHRLLFDSNSPKKRAKKAQKEGSRSLGGQAGYQGIGASINHAESKVYFLIYNLVYDFESIRPSTQDFFCFSGPKLSRVLLALTFLVQFLNYRLNRYGRNNGQKIIFSCLFCGNTIDGGDSIVGIKYAHAFVYDINLANHRRRIFSHRTPATPG